MATGNYYSLNELGARAWELLDETRTISEIAASLAAEYDAPQETIEEDLRTLLDQFVQAGLIVDAKTGSQRCG